MVIIHLELMEGLNRLTSLGTGLPQISLHACTIPAMPPLETNCVGTFQFPVQFPGVSCENATIYYQELDATDFQPWLHT